MSMPLRAATKSEIIHSIYCELKEVHAELRLAKRMGQSTTEILERIERLRKSLEYL